MLLLSHHTQVFTWTGAAWEDVEHGLCALGTMCVAANTGFYEPT